MDKIRKPAWILALRVFLEVANLCAPTVKPMCCDGKAYVLRRYSLCAATVFSYVLRRHSGIRCNAIHGTRRRDVVDLLARCRR